MTQRSIRSVSATLVTALLAGIAGVVGSYALAGYTSSFVAAPVASFVTQNAPPALLKFAIGPLTALGESVGIEHLGQQANLLFAIGLGAVLFACLTLAALATGRRVGSAGGANGSVVAVGLAGVLVWVAATLLTGAPVTALGAGVASGLVVAVAELAASTTETGGAVSGGRREVLGGVVSALGVGVVGYLLGGRNANTAGPTPLSGVGGSNGTDNTNGKTNASDTNASRPDNANDSKANGANDKSADNANPSTIKENLAEAEAKSFNVEGLEGLVSGDDFYQVDIANVNPSVKSDGWSLSVTGAVDNEREFSYNDITGMDSVDRFKTLRCVSDPLNGKNVDNALWTGVPMKRILDGVNPKGKFVMLRAADNYYEEFPVEALQSGLLAYGMDGTVLPEKHGYPVRALIPGHWGEINVKWLSEIEVLDRPAKGFWEKKKWHGTGPVNTVAKLHATNRLDNGRIEVAGHAYAGTRGVKRVEVSTDGGNSWSDAKLSKRLEPTLAGDVWRQWRHTYQPPGSNHQVVVRAVDDSGTTQAKKTDNPFPSGAGGWVSKTIK